MISNIIKNIVNNIVSPIRVGGFGPELITNGGMELDANWNNQGTPTVNERSLEQVHGGNYSRKFRLQRSKFYIWKLSIERQT